MVKKALYTPKHAEILKKFYKMKTPTLPDYGLLTILAAVWGSSFMFIKIAVETIPALPMTSGRLGIAALVGLAVMFAMKQRLPSGLKTWGLMVIVAIFGNALPFALISWGEEGVDSGLAAILMAVMPLTTILLVHFFTDDEKLNLWKMIGVVLGIVGVIVLMGPTKLVHLGDDIVRQVSITFAAVCYGIATLFVKKIKDVPQISMTAGILALSALVMLPFGLLTASYVELTPSTVSLIAMVLLGVLHTAAANLLAYSIVRRLGATFFAQLNFMVPLFGVLFAVLFLKETISWNAGFALLIILLGVGIARYGILKSLKQNDQK